MGIISSEPKSPLTIPSEKTTMQQYRNWGEIWIQGQADRDDEFPNTWLKTLARHEKKGVLLKGYSLERELVLPTGQDSKVPFVLTGILL